MLAEKKQSIDEHYEAKLVMSLLIYSLTRFHNNPYINALVEAL